MVIRIFIKNKITSYFKMVNLAMQLQPSRHCCLVLYASFFSAILHVMIFHHPFFLSFNEPNIEDSVL